jgi:hypothetical protein
MLVRAVQPIAKRIASRLLTPKAAPQKLVQQLPQLSTRTAPRTAVRQFTPRTPWQTKLFKPRPYYQKYAKQQNWWLPTALGACALTASIVQNHAESEKNSSSSVEQKAWTAVEERYRKEFAQEETQLMQEACQILGITQAEWDQAIPALLERYNKRIHDELAVTYEIPLSINYVTMVHEMLQKSNIDLKSIKIVRNDNFKGNIGVAGNTTKGILCINERYCTAQNYSNDELKAYIAHEIQHLIHDDSFFSELTCVGNMNCKKVILWNRKYKKFKERRADISAGLANLSYTQALRDIFATKGTYNSCMNYEEQIEDAFDIENLWYTQEHPAYKTRFTYMDKLYWEMMACVEQQKKSETAKS